MNIRKIVTYNNLRRQFTPEELAFADQLYSATESEKELIVESLQPQKPAGKKMAGKTRTVEHCDACDYTKRHFIHKDVTRTGYHEFQSSKPKKSARASGMAAAISGSLQRSRSTTGGLPEGVSQFCIAQIDDNGGLMECGETVDHNSHHKQTDPNYHPFRSAAQPAEPPSPPSTRDDDYEVNFQRSIRMLLAL